MTVPAGLSVREMAEPFDFAGTVLAHVEGDWPLAESLARGKGHEVVVTGAEPGRTGVF